MDALYFADARPAQERFSSIWLLDFEYQSTPGNSPQPVCMVASEIHTGQTITLWQDDLSMLPEAPFDTGPNSLVVAYYSAAELGCFLELGWTLPKNVLDLYVEHRVDKNGVGFHVGNSLIDALRIRGLPCMEQDHKSRMRKLILTQTSWSPSQRAAILKYCEEDVRALAPLLAHMACSIDLPRALLRGRYMSAVARMERAGVPIDHPTYSRMVEQWTEMQQRLVHAIDRPFGVFDGVAFKRGKFAAYLKHHDIPWPISQSGHLKLDDATFKQQALLNPQLAPLRELRKTLATMRGSGLEVGSDHRNRTSLNPFASVTGRNQPSSTRLVFGNAKWMRGLVKPSEGYGLACIDFSAQEIAIAGALSGDDSLICAYESGDPYLAFAKAARLVPPDATKETHKSIRDSCKSVVLGVNYGMGTEAMAVAAGITRAEASDLVSRHKKAYPQFWKFANDSVDASYLNRGSHSVFGWRRSARDAKPTSLVNFPMQANGAEMMRIAAIAATEAGIEVCAPIHDAFLICAPLDRLNADVISMRGIMEAAGRAVTDGISVRTDAQIIRWPDRYMDENGRGMWDRVMSLMDTAA